MNQSANTHPNSKKSSILDECAMMNWLVEVVGSVFARGSVFKQAGRAVLQNFKKVYEMTPQKCTFSEVFEKFQNFYLF